MNAWNRVNQSVKKKTLLGTNNENLFQAAYISHHNTIKQTNFCVCWLSSDVVVLEENKSVRSRRSLSLPSCDWLVDCGVVACELTTGLWVLKVSVLFETDATGDNVSLASAIPENRDEFPAGFWETRWDVVFFEVKAEGDCSEEFSEITLISLKSDDGPCVEDSVVLKISACKESCASPPLVADWCWTWSSCYHNLKKINEQN